MGNSLSEVLGACTAYIISIAAIIVILFPGLVGVHYSSTRDGEHSGYVTAMESRGIIWQNWRVYFKTDNSSSQEDVYCVSRNDTELVSKLRDANKSRQQVVINYDGMRGLGFGICHNEYIKSVDVVTN